MFDAGRGLSSGHGRACRLSPVSTRHTALAQPTTDAGGVDRRADLLVSVDRLVEVADRLVMADEGAP